MINARRGRLAGPLAMALLAVVFVVSGCRSRESFAPSGDRKAPVEARASGDSTKRATVRSGASPAQPLPDAEATRLSHALPPAEAALLEGWYRAVGPLRTNESFGQLVARAARVQLGKPYLDEPAPPGPEELTIRLEDFQCVSLVESSLAVARCVTRGTADGPCFVREVEASRYRGGRLNGFASKLHYFSEWVSDGAQRGRLRELSGELGGAPHPARFDYMSRHAGLYAPLADAAVLSQIQSVEARLREEPAPLVVDRAHLEEAQRGLESGDIVALVGPRSGLLVSHAALVLRDERGVPRLVHASSAHHRVVISEDDVRGFVLRRPERLGIMVARPLPPPPGFAKAP